MWYFAIMVIHVDQVILAYGNGMNILASKMIPMPIEHTPSDFMTDRSNRLWIYVDFLSKSIHSLNWYVVDQNIKTYSDFNFIYKRNRHKVLYFGELNHWLFSKANEVSLFRFAVLVNKIKESWHINLLRLESIQLFWSVRYRKHEMEISARFGKYSQLA